MKNKIAWIAFGTATLLFAGGVIGYQDWQLRGSAPSNPGSGYLRIWADTTAGKFKCLTSGGSACFFDSATTGTVTSVATTSPLTGGAITGTGTIACSTCTVTVASGTSALGTSAISSAACATAVSTSATGTATTDSIIASFNADPTSTTGYSASTSGMLTIIGYPTTNNVNWRVCNNTASSITPGAITLNWRVVR